ncbi:MAG: aconitate hydratase AcnA [Deltaproteobacteria bacterium]|nr:aconitate hydratase AcnA [Deltaproteobacteria bacterium]
MSQTRFNPFGARATLKVGTESLGYYRLARLKELGVIKDLEKFPFSIRVLLENLLRNCDGFLVTEEDVKKLAAWNAPKPAEVEVPFKPARVILQDFTGVPVLVDIAAMRASVQRLGGKPARINPLVPVDLVIDHSVQVDHYGSDQALALNAKLEFQRNMERYEFLRWGQNAVQNFRVVPPATGIVHQVNLEYLAPGLLRGKDQDGNIAYPDTLVGTDSHTTMINALGVLGWGVGGIEAEAAMLGQPLFMLTPQVIGFKVHGTLKPGVTATDLTLTITQMLRKKGVVDKFVEFYGPGISAISLPDRATMANMAPEYGATMGFFPVDAETIEFLRRTGRPKDAVAALEAYCKEQGLFRTDQTPDPVFTDSLELNLGEVEPCLAGPKRPQDRVTLKDMQSAFRKALTAPVKDRGFGLGETDLGKTARVEFKGETHQLGHGAVVITAITSCTNTSNPSVLIAAGLLAQKAVEKGLKVPSYVKTSLAPGSRVVTEYLREAGLLPSLEKLGFNVVGYGCTTCIGNSGPLPDEVGKPVTEAKLVASAVISGNRNFEGRVHPLVKANYLASPPLVVAYAIAGSTDKDLNTEPLGTGKDGKPVFLKDIWPTDAEISGLVKKCITPAMFEKSYGDVFKGTPEWQGIKGSTGELYQWNEKSTYIQEPPFFIDLKREPGDLKPITGARALAVLGDSVTTDHISPAGDIAEGGPAARYLKEHGVTKADFNSFGSRRGNDRVMTRGTFANIRLKNLMCGGQEGGITVHQPSGQQMDIHDASVKYQQDGVPLVVVAGKEYGTGSSRDWAAKGTLLLGVKAVIAESFERIHRSNLVGMGVLPLVFKDGQNAESLGITGKEVFHVDGISNDVKPRQDLTVRAVRPDGTEVKFTVTARLDTPVDVHYYRNGGILQAVLRNLVKG